MIENHYIILFVVLISALLLGLITNRFLLNRPPNFLVKKANKSAIRWSSQSKPVFGGVTFFGLFLIAFVSYILIFDKNLFLNQQYIALFLIVTLSFLMGLADDIINTPPSFKFIVQLLNAVILIAFGVIIKISPIPALNYAITILWVVGIMNSINMLDNMDSITNLVSLSIFTGIFASLLISNSAAGFIPYLLMFVIGGSLSFLYYNWNPSKMYMGDNGSQFLGAILAFLGIIFFWNALPLEEMSFGYNSKQALIVLLAFIIPITDTTTVTINRLSKGKSPFVGGRDHTTHHLSYAGLSDRRIAVLLFITNSITVAIACYLIYYTDNLKSLWFWILFSFALIIFATLYSTTKLFKPK